MLFTYTRRLKDISNQDYARTLLPKLPIGMVIFKVR